MPRVHFVKKARKDNRVVKKGESYYWWKPYRSVKRMSKTYPRQSQLTSSDKKARLYEAQESVEDSIHDGEEALRDALTMAAETCREVGEEYRESAESQREYFPDSDSAYEWEDWADQCDTLADELKEVAGDDVTGEDFISAVENIDWEVPYW